MIPFLDELEIVEPEIIIVEDDIEYLIANECINYL